MDFAYLPLDTTVNCTNPSAGSDTARVSYACSPTDRLPSTIIHLLFITAMVLLTALVYACYRTVQNSKAKRAIINCAVAATAAAGSREHALTCLASACAVAPAMLKAAAELQPVKGS